MIELSDEMRMALQGLDPVRLRDPMTDITYVLIREDAVLRITVMVDDTDPDAMYPLLADIEPEDWENPAIYGIT